jgi:uncharacterized protein
MEKPFNCWNCGACCKLCNKVEELRHLDRGDGTCIHLTEENKCSIYETRPEICNTKIQYAKKWSKWMTWDSYVDYSEKVCKILEKSLNAE